MKLKNKFRTIFCLFLFSLLLFTGCSPETEDLISNGITSVVTSLSEDGTYTSKEDVAAYLNEYGHLPSNFITKKEAKKLGWCR